MKSKSKTYNVVAQFIKQMKNQTSHTVKMVQIGGGTECKTLKNYFHDKGIVHRVTFPYTSEQNGLVERIHRQIVETGHTLLAQASLPLKF